MADEDLVDIYAANPITTPVGDELIYLVTDPGGTADDGGITTGDLLAAAGNPVTVASVIGSGAGNITTTSTTFVNMTGIAAAIAAVAGDHLVTRWSCDCFVNSGSNNIGGSVNVGAVTGDVRGTSDIHVGAADTNSRWFGVEWPFTVVAGDISGGLITVQARFRINSAGTLNVRNGTLGVPVLIITNYGQ